MEIVEFESFTATPNRGQHIHVIIPDYRLEPVYHNRTTTTTHNQVVLDRFSVAPHINIGGFNAVLIWEGACHLYSTST